MIVVFHWDRKHEPIIYYDMTKKEEADILRKLRKDWRVERAVDWNGHSNPKYGVHHYNIMEKR